MAFIGVLSHERCLSIVFRMIDGRAVKTSSVRNVRGGIGDKVIALGIIFKNFYKNY